MLKEKGMVCFGNRRGIKEKHTTPISSPPLFTFLASQTVVLQLPAFKSIRRKYELATLLKEEDFFSVVRSERMMFTDECIPFL